MLVVFEDRDRIGRDLHDLVIQRLFAIGLGLENTARLVDRAGGGRAGRRAVDDIDETIKDIRRSIFALSAPTTRRRCGGWSARSSRGAERLGFRPTLRLRRTGGTRSCARCAAHLAGRAARGAVQRRPGTRRHRGSRSRCAAGRRWCWPWPTTAAGSLRTPTESGLRNMSERAEELGGTCVGRVRFGQGTTIRWSVPPRLTRPSPAAGPKVPAACASAGSVQASLSTASCQ